MPWWVLSTYLALATNSLQIIGVWFAGSFTSVMRGQYEMLWIVAIIGVIVFIVADRLTIAGLGEEIATNVGVNYNRIILLGTVLIAVTTGVVTVVVGNLLPRIDRAEHRLDGARRRSAQQPALGVSAGDRDRHGLRHHRAHDHHALRGPGLADPRGRRRRGLRAPPAQAASTWLAA